LFLIGKGPQNKMLKKIAFEGLGLFPFGITGNNNKNKRERIQRGKGWRRKKGRRGLKKALIYIYVHVE
jgi:hypothetical protein